MPARRTTTIAITSNDAIDAAYDDAPNHVRPNDGIDAAITIRF